MLSSQFEMSDEFVLPVVELEHKPTDAISHDQIIALLELLGYKIDKKGMCFGIGIMGLVSLLSKALEDFEKRNVYLGQRLREGSIAELAEAIQQIEAKRVAAIAGYKKELLIALGHDIRMNDAKFYRLIKKKQFKNDPNVLEYKKKYNEVDSILNDEERALSDAHAYLEGICVSFFSSSELPDLYKMEDQIYCQDTETVLTRVLPHKLAKKPDLKGIKRLKKLIKSLTKEKSLVRKANLFVGFYDPFSLVDYLQELCLISIRFHYEPIVFMLHSTKHALVISYNPVLSCWCLIDANKLPSKKYYSHEALAYSLFTSFFVQNNLTLSTEVFCNEKILELLKKVIAERKETTNWKNLHGVFGKYTLVDDDKNSLIDESARMGDLVLFKDLLACRNPEIDINAGENGKTPFNIAVKHNQTEIVKLILKNKLHKPNPNILYSGAHSALSMAVLNHNIKLIKLLLKIKNPKIQIDLAGQRALTALQEAIYTGDLKIVKTLLKAGADIHKRTIKGDSLIHIAINSNHLNIVEELLRRKVDLEVVSSDGDTPLSLAVKNKRIKIVQAILNNKYHHIDPAAEVKNSVSPLFRAAEVGDVEIMKLLFAHENLQHTNIKPVELVRIAVKQGHLEAVRFLLEHESIKNTFQHSIPCMSMAAMTAIQYKHPGIFEMIMECKRVWGDVSQIVLENGSTFLHAAAMYDNVTALEAMLESKRFDSQLNNRAENGETPLYIAVKYGHVDIVKALMRAGADPNIPNADGTTPLMLAIQQGNCSIISELLTSKHPKVDVNKPDEDGYTPLYRAVATQNIQVVRLLLDSKDPKVDPYFNVNGYSPLGYAAYNDDLAMVMAILEHENFKKDAKSAYEDVAEALINSVEYDRRHIVKAILYSKVFLSDKVSMAEHINKARETADEFGHTDISKTISQFLRDLKADALKRLSKVENSSSPAKNKKPTMFTVKKARSKSKSPLGKLSVFSAQSPEVKLALAVKAIDGTPSLKRTRAAEPTTQSTPKSQRII